MEKNRDDGIMKWTRMEKNRDDEINGQNGEKQR